MKYKFPGWAVIPVLWLVAPHHVAVASPATSVDASSELATGDSRQYLRLEIDNLVIDTDGLVAASQSLAQAVDRLGQSIETLADSDEVLSAEDRAAVLGAVQSVDRASAALADVATRLPQTLAELNENLPAMIENARAPLADLSDGLRYASDGVVAITDSLPDTTARVTAMVDEVLNAALLRASVFVILLFVVIALATIWVIGYIYKAYIEPVIHKLDALVGAPEHFASLARHMKETSDNLLLLQAKPPKKAPVKKVAANRKTPPGT